MLFKRKTAVRPEPRNILGRRPRRRLTIEEVRAMEAAGLPRDEILNLLDLGYLLPLMGGTTSSNTVMANPVYFPKNIVVSTDQTINQGDLVWWDPVNFTLKALTLASQVAVSAAGGFAGVAQGQSNPAVYPAPAGGIPAENLPGVAVQRGGSVKLNSTTGEGGYFPFEPVTVGADSQTVSRGGQTVANRVGFIIVTPPVNARAAPGATPAPETALSGSPVEVWIEAKFPDTALL